MDEFAALLFKFIDTQIPYVFDTTIRTIVDTVLYSAPLSQIRYRSDCFNILSVVILRFPRLYTCTARYGRLRSPI